MAARSPRRSSCRSSPTASPGRTSTSPRPPGSRTRPSRPFRAAPPASACGCWIACRRTSTRAEMAEGACEVWFYHLERTSLDQALPELLEKTLARDWLALVRTPSPERIEHLDGWLWSYRDDAFLPHGTEHE